MADIEYLCVQCKASRVVSEFADVAKLKCTACGANLRKAGEPPPPSDRGEETPVSLPAAASISRLKVAKKQYEQGDSGILGIDDAKTSAPTSEASGGRGALLDLHPKVKRKIAGPNKVLLAFLLFAVSGALTGYLRYAGVMDLPGASRLPQHLLDNAMQFAWIGILGLNIVVVIRALNDNIFQGILCLLVPGWSIIYLLLISDNFFLRAIVFGCLIGLGQDGGVQIYNGAAYGMRYISAFIDSGGGEVRLAPKR